MAFGDLGGEIQANPDMIWEDAAWPNNTTKDSSVFMLGGAQGKVELVGKNTGSAATGALTITLYHADNETDAAAGSTNASTATLLSAGTGTSWALGAELFRFAPSTEIGAYASLRLTTGADKSSEKLDVYMRPVDG